MDLQTRAKNMIVQPAQEWPAISGETTTVGGLLQGYAAPLSAISAIGTWLGLTFAGFGFVRGFTHAVVTWVFGLVGAWIGAIVVEKLAPNFGSRGDTVQALKLVVYSSTPVWLAGVFYAVPALGPLAVLGALYALYLFYVGLPPVMHTPQDKVIPYMVVAILAIVIVMICVGFVTNALAGVGSLTQ